MYSFLIVKGHVYRQCGKCKVKSSNCYDPRKTINMLLNFLFCFCIYIHMPFFFFKQTSIIFFLFLRLLWRNLSGDLNILLKRYFQWLHIILLGCFKLLAILNNLLTTILYINLYIRVSLIFLSISS